MFYYIKISVLIFQNNLLSLTVFLPQYNAYTTNILYIYMLRKCKILQVVTPKTMKIDQLHLLSHEHAGAWLGYTAQEL